MRSFKIGIVLLVSIVSLLYSCQKDDKLGEYLLTDEIKAQNPYQEGDSFVLISNSGDTLSWYVKGRSDQIYEYYYDHTMAYYLVEIDKANIELENSDENVFFQLEMGGDLTPIHKLKLHLNNGVIGSAFSFYLPLSKASSCYIDSLFIRNRWIKDVFKHETVSENIMYYSTEFGILKIDFSDGSFWELESIHWAERE